MRLSLEKNFKAIHQVVLVEYGKIVLVVCSCSSLGYLSSVWVWHGTDFLNLKNTDLCLYTYIHIVFNYNHTTHIVVRFASFKNNLFWGDHSVSYINV